MKGLPSLWKPKYQLASLLKIIVGVWAKLKSHHAKWSNCQNAARWAERGCFCQHFSWSHILFEARGRKGQFSQAWGNQTPPVGLDLVISIILYFFYFPTTLHNASVCMTDRPPCRWEKSTSQRCQSSWWRTPGCVNKAANNHILSSGSSLSDWCLCCCFHFPPRNQIQA